MLGGTALPLNSLRVTDDPRREVARAVRGKVSLNDRSSVISSRCLVPFTGLCLVTLPFKMMGKHYEDRSDFIVLVILRPSYFIPNHKVPQMK